MDNDISVIKVIDGVRYIMVDYIGANLVGIADTIKSENSHNNPYGSCAVDGVMLAASFLVHVISEFDKQELAAIAKVSDM